MRDIDVTELDWIWWDMGTQGTWRGILAEKVIFGKRLPLDKILRDEELNTGQVFEPVKLDVWQVGNCFVL